jgi:hypothetical protein
VIGAVIVASAMVAALSLLCALDALCPWDDGGLCGRDRWRDDDDGVD